MSDRPEMGENYGDIAQLERLYEGLKADVARCTERYIALVDKFDRLTNELERDRRVRPFVDAALVEDMINRLRALEGGKVFTRTARNSLFKQLDAGAADDPTKI